ncbi:hypothetical protein [Acidipropionibacterium virtanenii]|uniref:Uncharacterized protein n=1 Tax=Acidipropionibacterium virtanenii TaxID=2057246 RepID=A0A344UW47_9ACTN|nr:hypothetical protein [Acidipropionibacterium virtanenii]AXE39495.1 hypothetical protein JS278_02354 [Acidipropionibacterium virtanenii]
MDATDQQGSQDYRVRQLAANIRSACRVRRWEAADLAGEASRRGAPLTEERAAQLLSGDQEPLISEAAAVAAAFDTSVEALMARPDDFERALAWTSVRHTYKEARRRLMRSAGDYEKASEMLCDYMDGDSHIPQLERDELEHQLAQSCAWVAMDAYEDHNPWRHRWGIAVDPDDPASRI